MRFLLVFVFCCAMAFTAFTPAYGTTSPTTTPATTTETEALPVVTEATTLPIGRVALSSTAQARITNLAANISNQLDASIRRNENVLRRLEARRLIIAESGQDTTVAATQITAGITSNDNARALLSTIDTEVALFVGSNNPLERFIEIRNRYTAALDATTSAHKSAVEALLVLKNPAPLEANTATTSTPSE
jgi:hypothetical protein